MSVNLLNQLQEQIGEVLTTKSSNLFNETREGIQLATGAIMPALLGTLVQKGSSENGAKALLKIIKEDNYNGGLLENIGDILGDRSNALDDLLEKGSALVADLAGDHQPGLTDMIANYAGTDKESTSSLIHLAAPLLMSLLGKHVQQQGLNAGGLMSLLAGQKEAIKSASPAELAGIGKLLGLSGELSDLGKVPEQARTGRSLAWIIGVVALLLIAALIYLFVFRKSEPAPAAERLIDTIGQTAQPASPGSDLPAPNGISSRISTFLSEGGELQGQVFAFSNPTFSEQGAQPVQPDRALKREVDDLATLLNRYPNLNVLLTVFAPGDLELAQFRAVALKNRLQNQGVSSDRISVAGDTGADNRIEVELTRIIHGKSMNNDDK